MTDKQQSFIEHYCTDAANNASLAYKMAYPKVKSGWNAHGARLMAKDSIKQAIKVKRAELTKKIEHSFEIAVEMLTQRLVWLDKKAKEGNVQAIQAQTAIIRELNCITGLQKQTIKTETVVPTLSEAEKAASEAAARAYKLRLA